MYIVTTQQMQAAEKAADASGLSYDEMMENAGRAVAETIEAHFQVAGKHILILIGPGNNGGDGLVAARHLAAMGASVAVYVWKRNTGYDKNWALLDEVDVERVFDGDQSAPARLTHLLAASTIIVDALLGTGVSRPIAGTLAGLLDQTRAAITGRHSPQEGPLLDPTRPNFEPEFEPVVVALDVPSGLNSDTGATDPHTLAADMTVTLASVKWGHILGPGLNVVGRLVVADIGLTRAYYPDDVTLEMATAAKVAGMLPPRPVAAHKGTFGTALLVAGSINYSGAAILAGQAAARIGTGLVSMAPPKAIHPIVAACLSEATYWPLPDQDGMLAPGGMRLLKERFTQTEALLVGPGLGSTETTTGFLKELLAEAGSLPPLIVDADALNILASQEEWWSLLPAECILTPHPGEMARLTGLTTANVQANRLELAEKMATKWRQVVLLKGAHTIVAHPHGRTMVLPFATPALAKAGSGDVLAGAIVGLRAQGLPAFEAAVAGAYLHGLAGQFAGQDLGQTATIAGDLVEYLPAAIRAVKGWHD